MTLAKIRPYAAPAALVAGVAVLAYLGWTYFRGAPAAAQGEPTAPPAAGNAGAGSMGQPPTPMTPPRSQGSSPGKVTQRKGVAR